MCGGSARLFCLIALAVTPLVARAGERVPAPVFSGGFVSDDLAFDLSTPTWCCSGLPADPLPQPTHELRALPPDPSSTLFMLYALGSLAAVEVSAGLKKLALNITRSGHGVDVLRAQRPAGPRPRGCVWNVVPAVLMAASGLCARPTHAGMWQAPGIRGPGRPNIPRAPPV